MATILNKTERKLLQAETEILRLKDLMYRMRYEVISPAEKFHNGENVHEKMKEARDFDYTDIPIASMLHRPKKDPIGGCLCWRCDECRRRRNSPAV